MASEGCFVRLAPIRDTVRFLRGVPHPHLLGVRARIIFCFDPENPSRFYLQFMDTNTLPSLSPWTASFRNWVRAFAVVGLLAFGWSGLSQPATQGPLTCVVCGKTPLTGKVAVHKYGHVCEECVELKTRCYHCGLPIKDESKVKKTSDGRLFCEKDLPNLVFSTNETQTVFAEATDAVLKITANAMALRQPKIEVSLTDVDDWNANGIAAELKRQGFSKSRKVGQEFSHIVSLLSGQARSGMRTTCAHEYTHLWINENKPEERKIDGDTVEAICELVAYKVAQNDGNSDLQKDILANPYTKGMITNLVAFEAQYGMADVLTWVKKGTGEKLSMEGVTLASEPAPVVKTEFPSGITLSGLMGSRIAVVSGVMIKKGERRKIQLKEKAVSVRCLEINKDNVVVQIEGEKAPVTLKLGDK